MDQVKLMKFVIGVGVLFCFLIHQVVASSIKVQTEEIKSINKRQSVPCINDTDCPDAYACLENMGTCELCEAWHGLDTAPDKCLQKESPNVTNTINISVPCMEEIDCKLGYWCYQETCQDCHTLDGNKEVQRIECANWLAQIQSTKKNLTIYIVLCILTGLFVIVFFGIIFWCCKRRKQNRNENENPACNNGPIRQVQDEDDASPPETRLLPEPEV
ncbi:uncharacterized protein LOC144356861 [Saccoglossus kowalevskii]